MTIDEMNKLLQAQWMAMSEEERFLTCGRLYEAERAVLERLAPPSYSPVELRQFVFFHMHGYPMPEGARRMLEARAEHIARS